jgi:hypothetical protein
MPLGSVQHMVAQHWASPRESAEFLTGVKEVLGMYETLGLQDIHRGGMSFRPQGCAFVDNAPH